MNSPKTVLTDIPPVVRYKLVADHGECDCVAHDCDQGYTCCDGCAHTGHAYENLSEGHPNIHALEASEDEIRRMAVILTNIAVRTEDGDDRWNDVRSEFETLLEREHEIYALAFGALSTWEPEAKT